MISEAPPPKHPSMFPTWPSKGEKYAVVLVDDAQGYHCTHVNEQLNIPLINFYPFSFISPTNFCGALELQRRILLPQLHKLCMGMGRMKRKLAVYSILQIRSQLGSASKSRIAQCLCGAKYKSLFSIVVCWGYKYKKEGLQQLQIMDGPEQG
jgi:hypothetical protein